MNRKETEAAARALRPPPSLTVVHSTEPIAFTANGYGVEPCPACGDPLLPGEPRLVRPGEWRPHHELCMDCAYCGESHTPPHDGSCLL